ncbi:MAG: lipoyl synthase [Candidatus Aureabacteria bacterium]|nr:lipoyl synthase [Candidatus Auribacterota bacterium]
MLAETEKPPWINKKIRLKDCRGTEAVLDQFNVNTVCQKALCPNRGECFASGHATFLILGPVCTRNCGFCGVSKGKPSGVDASEPRRIAMAAKSLNYRHCVITSVTRDDLADGGSGIFAETVLSLREELPHCRIEILIPDFSGDLIALHTVVRANPDIIGHNIETVPRLYKEIRSGSSYERSLQVLETIKKLDNGMYTKSGIMLGMGERRGELLDVFDDLAGVRCDFLSLGQYLSPGPDRHPVKDYIRPRTFDYYKEKALERGLKFVMSAPYVRSSYNAYKYLGVERGRHGDGI